MANRDPKNLITDDRAEDVTQYGEFIPSFHHWTTFESQQNVVGHLQDCTEKVYKVNHPKSYRE